MLRILLALAVAAVSIDPAAAHHVMDGRLPTTLLQGLLSGFGHPIIGLDHFAAVVAVGCIAGTQSRGARLVLGFIGALMIGTAVHLGKADLPYGEMLVALSVIALGMVMALSHAVPPTVALGLFVLTGFFHGYALGESIVGAEPAPLYAYLAGLAIIQSAIALGAMAISRRLFTWPSFDAVGLRLVGAGIAGFGIALVVQQLTSGA